MSWKPTEGLKRAEYLVHELCSEAAAADSVIHPLYRWRMIEVISKAIDQALSDGAERDALDKVVGNGHAPLELEGFLGNPQSSGLWVPVGNGHADPVIEAHEEGPGSTWIDPPAVSETVAATVSTVSSSESAAPKKRGRPKGSKGKPKAKAKKEKAAKVSDETVTPATEAMMEALTGEAPSAEATP